MTFKAHSDKGRWTVLHHGKSLPLPSGGYRNPTTYYCEARDRDRAEHIARALNHFNQFISRKKLEKEHG